MIVIRELRRQGRQIAGSLLGVITIGYFAYHAVEGERGLRSYFALRHATTVAAEDLVTLRAEREALEQRVRLLRPDGLDLDMLDERARSVLGLVQDDEIVILTPDGNR